LTSGRSGQPVWNDPPGFGAWGITDYGTDFGLATAYQDRCLLKAAAPSDHDRWSPPEGSPDRRHEHEKRFAE
jgi:hypothetical protein